MLGYLRHRASGPCETTNQTSLFPTGSGRVLATYDAECPLSINSEYKNIGVHRVQGCVRCTETKSAIDTESPQPYLFAIQLPLV